MSGLLEAVQKTEIPDIYAVQRVLSSEEDQEDLFRMADAAKNRVFGSTVFVPGVIEFSSYCERECAYCGLNRNVAREDRYRMTPDEVVEAALTAAELYSTIILKSGEDVWYTSRMLADIIGKVRSKTSVTITMAVGERSPDAYRAMRDAGANRFLIRHETAEALLHEDHDARLEAQPDAQNALQDMGFEVASGFLVGLPGQDNSIVAADILMQQQQSVDMADISPFVAHQDTIVAEFPDGSPVVALRALAVMRVLLPKCHLPASAALAVKGSQMQALQCGADMVLQNATPLKYQKLFDPYPGREVPDGSLKDARDRLFETLRDMRLEPA